MIAAAYAGFAGGLLGVLQAFMPPGRLNLRHLRSACDADRNRRRRLKSKKKLSAIPLHAREAAKSEPRNESRSERSTPILQARGLTEPYGGLVGNSDIDFTVYQGELRGIIGPNGAGKTTLFKMLTCEIAPTSGTIVFDGRDITGMTITDVCQLGLTKSYQVNQLFTGLTVRDNLVVAALSLLRGKFRLDLFRSPHTVKGLSEQVSETLEMIDLTRRADRLVAELSYGEKRRLEIGLALATSPRLLLLDELRDVSAAEATACQPRQ